MSAKEVITDIADTPFARWTGKLTITGLFIAVVWLLITQLLKTDTLNREQIAKNLDKFVEIATKVSTNEAVRNEIDKDRIDLEKKHIVGLEKQAEGLETIAAIARNGKQERELMIQNQMLLMQNQQEFSETQKQAIQIQQDSLKTQKETSQAVSDLTKAVKELQKQ